MSQISKVIPTSHLEGIAQAVIVVQSETGLDIKLCLNKTSSRIWFEIVIPSRKPITSKEFRSSWEAEAYLEGIRDAVAGRKVTESITHRRVVVRCTGQLWHIFAQSDGRMAPVKHEDLPAYSLDSAMLVVGKLGTKLQISIESE